jgi:hypothetical protein
MRSSLGGRQQMGTGAITTAAGAIVRTAPACGSSQLCALIHSFSAPAPRII